MDRISWGSVPTMIKWCKYLQGNFPLKIVHSTPLDPSVLSRHESLPCTYVCTSTTPVFLSLQVRSTRGYCIQHYMPWRLPILFQAALIRLGSWHVSSVLLSSSPSRLCNWMTGYAHRALSAWKMMISTPYFCVAKLPLQTCPGQQQHITYFVHSLGQAMLCAGTL